MCKDCRELKYLSYPIVRATEILFRWAAGIVPGQYSGSALLVGKAVVGAGEGFRGKWCAVEVM
jgi:hypothetical protein